jgi:predicted aspartyl protease
VIHYLYSNNYDPAAPVFEVELGYPGAEPTLGPFEALVDTGADYTLVPLAHLHEVGALKASRARLRSHWGEARSVYLYAVAIQIGPHHLAAPQVVGDEIGGEIVLGRNVLNRLRLLLDGPGAVAEILDAT